MSSSLAVFFALLAVAAAASLGLGDILIESGPQNVLVANQNGQQVKIALKQQGALKQVNGPQTIVVEISGPGRISKIVELPDQQVGLNGVTQSDILQQIFAQANGMQNELTFQVIMDTVAAKVAAGKINPAVLAALETVSPRNQQIDTAANQILKQAEQKQLEKQAVTDALSQQFGGLGLGGGNVVVEAGIDDILVANSNGQQVNIATKQQSRLGGPQVLQIQVTGPGVVARTFQVIDQQVGPSQSDILLQIAQQNRGVQNGQTYQILLNQVSVAVAGGQVSPAVLVALEAVAPQNQGNPIAINQHLEQAQQVASTQNNLQSGLIGQGFGLGGQGLGLAGQNPRLRQLGSLQAGVLVEVSLGQIVVANEQGQQVRIVANQQTAGLLTPQTIVIQLTGAGGLSNVIQIIDQQIAPGLLESDILQQIAQQYSGLQSGMSYQALLNTVAAKVATGQLSSAILSALEAVSPENQLSQNVVAQQIQLAQQMQLQQGQFAGLLGSSLGRQPQILAQQRTPLSTLESSRFSQALGNQGLRSGSINQQIALPLGTGLQSSNLVGLQRRILNQL